MEEKRRKEGRKGGGKEGVGEGRREGEREGERERFNFLKMNQLKFLTLYTNMKKVDRSID